MIELTLATALSAALSQSEYATALDVIHIEKANPNFGDFATSVSFKLAKTHRQNPMVIAEKLAQLCQSDSWFSENTDCVATQGFLNFRLKDTFLAQSVDAILNSKYPPTSGRFLLEYVSANPTGPLHIGHGRWAVMGSTIANLLREIGVSVHTEFYINDAGTQIQNFYASVEAVRQNQPIPENGYHGHYIQVLAQQGDDPVKVMINQQKHVLDSLGVAFDAWFYESSLHQRNQVELAIQKLTEKGLTYTEEGALWFASSRFGDEKDRVLVKADGQKTYFAVDVAYHLEKLSRGFSHLINIWGADHHGYVPRVRASVKALAGDDFEVESHFKILIGQLVSLFRNGEPVRMSKRTGEMVTLEEVVEEIGVDATRFFLIQKSQDTHVDFDLELAKQKSMDNPVYYIQYAYARISRIWEKLLDKKPTAQLTIPAEQITDVDRPLLLHLLEVEGEIYHAARSYSPHRIANYVLDLAKLFHPFYERSPILRAEGDVQAYRIAVMQRVQAVLKKSLTLLGLSAPDSM